MKWMLFAFSIVLVIFLRFYHLGITPYGLNVDEASYGYDAYSILKTARDQWGAKLPLSLTSFGDAKPAGLSYLMIPFIQVFDLNTLSTRLPSAIAGIIIVGIFYLILQYLNPSKWNIFLSTIFAFMPWSYGISRLFYEPNIALVFFMLGWYLVLINLNISKSSFLYLAAVFFALSGYFYVAYRLISVLILAYATLSSYHISSFKKWLILACVTFGIFGIVSLPLLPSMLHGGGGTRLHQELSLRTTDHQMYIDDNRKMCYLASDKNPIIAKICYLVWNKPILKIQRMGETILTNFSPHYLFQNSYQPDIIPKGYGAYLSILAPLYLLGLLSNINGLLKHSKSKRQNLYILISFFILQIPGVIIEQPMVHRNLAPLFIVAIFIGLGWYNLCDYLNQLRYTWVKQFILTSFALAITFQGLSFLAYYHSAHVNNQPGLWRYGIDQIMRYTQSQESRYNSVVFDGFEDPILYYAFYTKIEPNDFQKNSIMNPPNEQGWMHYASYKKFQAINIGLTTALCHYEKQPTSTLFISPPNIKYSKYRDYLVRDMTQVHPLYEAYDLSKLLELYKKDNPKHTTFCVTN